MLEELEEAPRRDAERAEHGSRSCRRVGLGRTGSIEPFDLDVHAGEVVGLAGLLGSGRTELARLLFGADRADRGEVAVDGRAGRSCAARARRWTAASPSASENRKAEGIVGDLSVRENIVLALQADRGWAPADAPPHSRTSSSTGTSRRSTSVRPTPNTLVAQPLRRQPAEGAAGPLAGHRAASC